MHSPLLTQLQLAVFFLNTEKRPDRIAYKVIGSVNKFQDLIPNISNFVTSFGDYAKVNRTNINIPDKDYYINISNERFDLFHNMGSSLEREVEIKEEFISISSQILKTLEDYPIRRIGVVRTAFYEDIDCDEYIRRNFLNNNINGYREINIRFNKQFTYKNRLINNMTNIYQGEYKFINEVKKGTFFYRDINNVPNEDPLQHEFIDSFFKKFINQDIMEI